MVTKLVSLAILLCLACWSGEAFWQPPLASPRSLPVFGRTSSPSPSADEHHKKGSSFLFDDFRTAKGEVVDPYAVLKVNRQASRQDIKASYRQLSRKYHPDMVRHARFLPGSCNNLEDARDHWERIKLSYEILSDKALRKKYDRHEVVADPGEALRRASVNAIFNGVKGFGKGIFDLSVFAVGQVVSSVQQNNEKQPKQKEAEVTES
jgi:DnaJ-class molecular chaperone